MSIIGSFIASDDEFSGRLRTFLLDLPVQIVPVNAPTERGPDYRLIAYGVEFGAGWKRTARDSGRESSRSSSTIQACQHRSMPTLLPATMAMFFYLVWTRFTPS